MSLKIERIASSIVKEISSILSTEVKDKDINFVTITSCDLTNDLGLAKVYYTILDDDKKKETAKALEKAKGYIRSELSKRLDLRHTPELRFIFDESVEKGMKIENIIKNINEKS